MEEVSRFDGGAAAPAVGLSDFGAGLHFPSKTSERSVPPVGADRLGDDEIRSGWVAQRISPIMTNFFCTGTRVGAIIHQDGLVLVKELTMTHPEAIETGCGSLRRSTRVVLFALAIGVASVWAGNAESASAAKTPRVPLADVPVDARVDVPPGPGWLGIGFGSVWISKSKSQAVYRINPVTNKVIAKIPVGPDAELGITAALGSIWIPDVKDHSVRQIDPARNVVARKIPLDLSDDAEGSIAVAGDSIWFVSNRGGTDAGTLVRVTLATGQTSATIPIPARSHAVEAAFGSIWVTSSGAGVVVRVDPNTNKVVARISVHAEPRFIVSGFGSIWTLSQSDGSLARIDPTTNRVIATLALKVPGPGGDLAIDESRVWVSAEGTPISLVDPKANTLRVQVVGGHELDTLRAGFGAIWLIDEAGGVLRFDPAKLHGALK